MRIRMITVRTWYLAESQHVDRKAKHRIKFQQIALPPMESMLAESATATQAKDLTEYVNSKQGYVLDRPTSWEQTSKAGADVLFTDPLRKSTTVGVTVNPIKIVGLQQFGDVETVRKKLIDTEKQKESTKGVMLISESSRNGKTGTLIYDIEYELDSTRGRKRILSTVAIAQKKLFIVNGNMKCDAGGCNEDSNDLALLRQVAGTFDVIV
ncbi:hypothetical protein ABBQ38_009651 [Trebouxia sp. C0009 RCD-2024]